jgi:cardiolipin synthase A/B
MPQLQNSGHPHKLAAMLAEAAVGNYRWLRAGSEAFPAMLAAIDAAQQSVRLETYIYSAGSLGVRFRETLVRARQRGAEVLVLVDAFGSIGLPAAFWKPLQAVGGEVRQFNPLSLNWLGIRNHRKLLVCDERVAFVGGFNIAPEFEGDGVASGWCDIGLEVEGPLAAQLAAAFNEMFARAEFRHKRFMRLRRSSAKKTVSSPSEQLLLSGPGRGRSPIKRALSRDLAAAANVQIIMAYFLPTWRIRRQLVRITRRGGQVQLILAGKTDVAVSQLAGQSLYRRFLKARVGICEYQPQILHAKLLIIDDIVYVGSANLDPRSLHINYELMVRFENKEMAAQARELFADKLQHCRQITLEKWTKSRTIWRRFKQHWAYFLLVRLDPYIARRQWRGLPD